MRHMPDAVACLRQLSAAGWRSDCSQHTTILSSRTGLRRTRTPEGKIKLDVLVTDASGHPVTGLRQENFTLLDNKKPRPILSFRAVDGTAVRSREEREPGEPPVEVVLLVDVTNTPLRVVGHERNQIESFLRRNGGRLTQPTSLMIFDDRGVKGLPQPTKDGNLAGRRAEQSRSDDAFDASDGTD